MTIPVKRGLNGGGRWNTSWTGVERCGVLWYDQLGPKGAHWLASENAMPLLEHVMPDRPL